MSDNRIEDVDTVLDRGSLYEDHMRWFKGGAAAERNRIVEALDVKHHTFLPDSPFCICGDRVDDEGDCHTMRLVKGKDDYRPAARG